MICQYSSFVSGSDTFVSLPTGHGKSFIYQLAIPLMKELSKRSDELSFHVPSHPMLLVVSPLTALINDQINSCERLGLKCCKLEDFKLGLLGLGSKLYPGNMQRMLNKDVTRFMQSLKRERQNRAI